MVCGAKRIRSLYLPWMTGVTPKLSTTIPPICAFAEQTSLPLLTHRGWKPLPQRSSSQSLQLGEKDGHIGRRSRWFVHNAG